MKPFIIGDKRLAFDVTNANDLQRLERAYAALCEKHEEVGEGGMGELPASEQMRAIFGMYHDFFAAVFPGRAAEIVGDVPSVSHAAHVFDRFTAYLRDALAEEEQNTRVMRRIYLGEGEAAGADGERM